MKPQKNTRIHQKSKHPHWFRWCIFAYLLAFLILLGFSVLPLLINTFDNSYQKSTNSQNLGQAKTTSTTDSETISVNLSAHNAYVVNLTTNTVLLKKSPTKEIAPASTTKLATALTVLDSCDMEDLVTVGDEIYNVPKDSSKADLCEGQQLTIRQLMEALLLPSGNDAAYVLASHTGKVLKKEEYLSTDEAINTFIDEMNKKAASIGATSTHFASPDGYDTDGQHTTAKDLSLFAKECLNNDDLKKILRSYEVTETLKSGETVSYTSTNELLNPESEYYLKNAIGLKTGSTSSAGYCLISAAIFGNDTYVAVVMDSTQDGRFEDSKRIYSAIASQQKDQ